MVIVWIGLVVLAVVIGVIIQNNNKARNAEDSPRTPDGVSAPAQAPQEVQVIMPEPELTSEYTFVPGPLLTRRDDALYAVISSAIAQTLESEGINPEGGFVIRSVKPVEELGPKLTLKDSALYALITAAVASTLQDEGVDPEAGFAIRSVKAL